jgi:hypothetical protein
MGQVYVYSLGDDELGNSRPVVVLQHPQTTHFGKSIWLDEQYGQVAVGAPQSDGGRGAAYVFSLDGAGVTFEPSYSKRTGERGDPPKFGSSVAIRGPDLFVGAAGQNRVFHFQGKQEQVPE